MRLETNGKKVYTLVALEIFTAIWEKYQQAVVYYERV